MVKNFVESVKDRFQLFFLPPYSPELNPDEWVWNDLKNNGIGRNVITTPTQLKKETAVARRTGSTNYVFTDENGKPYPANRVSMAFGRACKEAGMKDLLFHDLKHDFAALLAENDVEGFKRQRLLDHSDPRMSGKYTHRSPSIPNAIDFDAIEGKGIDTILSQEGDAEEGLPT